MLCIRLHRVSSCSSCVHPALVTSSCNCFTSVQSYVAPQHRSILGGFAGISLRDSRCNQHNPSSVLCTPAEGRTCNQYLGWIDNSEYIQTIADLLLTRQTNHNKANVLRLVSFLVKFPSASPWNMLKTEAKALMLGSGVHTEIRPVMTQFSVDQPIGFVLDSFHVSCTDLLHHWRSVLPRKAWHNTSTCC